MKTLTALIVTFLIMGLTGNLWAADSTQSTASGAAYLDVATGHRYLKNPDGTYAEFTKKGTLFRKSVPNDLPLLTTNKYIRQMGNNGVAEWDNPSISSGLGYSNNISTVSYDGKTLIATGNAYFDTATGHKYTRNPDGTYMEFTRKGKLFRKSVSNDLPLLTTNKYIRDLEESCYLLYVRTVNRQPRIMVLPSTQEHPEGWKCRVLISMK